MKISIKKSVFFAVLFCVSIVCISKPLFAEESLPKENQSIEVLEEQPNNVQQLLPVSSEEFVRQAWQASAQVDLTKVESIVQDCLNRYSEAALQQQALLTGFPKRGEEKDFQELNDVGTCLFIWAEALMNSGQKDRAIKEFENIINNYPWAQAWDPRGWYWSITEKSQASIDVLTGKVEEHADGDTEERIRTQPSIYFPATEKIVDYTKYGEFQDVGTSKYRYVIKDVKALAAAVGEGIYPNTSSMYNNPRYKILKDEGRLEGNHWDFVNTEDLEAAYFKWLTAPEPWGIRMFYVGMLFEKAGMIHEALRAYHSLVVHFPKTVGYTYWQTPWYPAQAAIAKIRYLLQINPDLGLEDQWMKITVNNGFDNDVANDDIVTYPGRIVPKGIVDKVKTSFKWENKIALGKIVYRSGAGSVQVVRYENGHWQLLVNGEPFVIKGITYAPTKIGQSPDKGTLKNWMEEDSNGNGLVDGPYDSWVDYNGNNSQDEGELVVGDFRLLKKMGTNVLRIYHDPETPNKELLRKMHKDFGIHVIMGDFLGKYTIGSGASWFEGTDYENEEHKKNMMESVRKMVLEHKDEPYLLLWVLGNENNYGVACNADKKPAAYFKFVDEVALMIKSIDPNHPVAVNNGDTLFLDIFAKNAPNVDIFSANVYRGNYGFGSFWEQVLNASGKPAFISEYGAPAYAGHLTSDEAEQAQADYHYGNWLDIEENFAGATRGSGNALGAIVFEWMDEWWKNYEPFYHDRKSDAVGPFPGGYYFEEWFGIVGQGNGQKSPFLRHLRKSYYLYEKLWNKQ